MKKIDVKYNADGYIESVTDNAVHFEQENDSLEINAQITTDKKVRAYIKAPNNNSAVTDELTPVDGVYSCMVDGDYMAKGTLYIGYELYDESGYTERLEPLKIYIDSFVNLGGGSSDNVYVVTVKVGTVETLATGEPATVENVGTKKDMILNFGLPRGDKGDKGDKGDSGEPFKYENFTEEQLNDLRGPQGIQGPKGDRGEQGVKGDKGDRGERGADGKDGINGADGKDGYTPQKGVDYFTAQDIKSLGIDDKVDKFDGKGLSTNDFTDEYKKQLDDGINIDVDIELSETSENPVANKVVTAELKKKVTAVNGKGLSSNDFTDDLKTRLENNTLSQTDLDNAIGDVETSLENIIAKYGLGGDGV